MFDLSFLPSAPDALILVPPFAGIRTPSLAAHLLQASARRAGFAVGVLYANMAFAAQADRDDYDALCEGNRELLGERVFAAAAYGLPPFGLDGARFIERGEVAGPGGQGVWRVPFNRLERLEALACAWIDRTASSIARLDCRVVGFSSSYDQISASIAIANAIKARRPDIVILMGGANCRGVQADGIASLSPHVDVVVRGEGEAAFVTLLQRLRRGELPAGRVVDGVPCRDLNDLPLPDYRDFFTQASLFLPDLDPRSLILPYDCARGCWWGRGRPCAFCGFDARRVPFREKSADVFLRDVGELEARYPSRWLTIAAPVVPRSYGDTVVPRLARQPGGLAILWVARAPISLGHALDLRRAGVAFVTFGIESLSTRLLEIMGKGTTAADNITALRHCRIAQLGAFYNLLFGIPGDTIVDYDRMAALIPLLRHLPPPDPPKPIEIFRFSPYFETPDRYGIANLRPSRPYPTAFPSTANVEQLAFRWDADYPSESIRATGRIRSAARRGRSLERAVVRGRG